VATQSPAAQTWRQAGGHQLVDRHGTPGTDLRPGPEEQIGVPGEHDHDQHEVDVPAEGLSVPSHSRGQGRTQVTNRRLRACPHTLADCRWHRRGQVRVS
jgi:hypothetical protein